MKVKRNMIAINEELCNGCGQCINGCPEGALQMVETPDGLKARVVKESFCDGLGACIGECPTGALKITEREVDQYDEEGVIRHLEKNRPEVLEKHMKHQHNHVVLHSGHHGISGCPGARAMQWDKDEDDAPSAVGRTAPPDEATAEVRPTETARSQLKQWPVQLHLLSPTAPYFRDADLVLSADCVPLAFAGFHAEFLKGRSVAIACPKLDDTTPYVQKLAAMIDEGGLRSITVLHMEVPCCGGLIRMAEQAIAQAGRKIPLNVQMITIRGSKA